MRDLGCGSRLILFSYSIDHLELQPSSLEKSLIALGHLVTIARQVYARINIFLSFCFARHLRDPPLPSAHYTTKLVSRQRIIPMDRLFQANFSLIQFRHSVLTLSSVFQLGRFLNNGIQPA